MLGFGGVIKWNGKAGDVLREPKPGERPLLQQSICYRGQLRDFGKELLVTQKNTFPTACRQHLHASLPRCSSSIIANTC